VDEHGWPVRVGDDDHPSGSSLDSGQGNGGRSEATEGDVLSLSHARRIDEIIETWRIDDEWWRTPISRRYVEVVLEGGGHVVLFEDLTIGQWFMQRP